MSNENKESFDSIQKYRRSLKSTNNNNKTQSNQIFDELESNENTDSVVNSLELAEQFTKALNSLEKLTYENNELKSKNKELSTKIEVFERKTKDFAIISNTINNINTNINDLNKWISNETQENANVTMDNYSIRSIVSNAHLNIPLDISDSFDYLKGKLGIIKYGLIVKSFS
jgi:predicted RNase H-like nuclease (RuvC/YqgF family)